MINCCALDGSASALQRFSSMVGCVQPGPRFDDAARWNVAGPTRVVTEGAAAAAATTAAAAAVATIAAVAAAAVPAAATPVTADETTVATAAAAVAAAAARTVANNILLERTGEECLGGMRSNVHLGYPPGIGDRGIGHTELGHAHEMGGQSLSDI